MSEDRTRENPPAAPSDEQLTQPVYPPGGPPYPPPGPPRRRRRRSPSPVWQAIKVVLIVLAMIVAALLGAALIAGVVIYNSLATELTDDLTRLDSMEGIETFETTYIYDRSGQVQLYEVFTEGRRTAVPLDRIPFALRWATIATEDSTFYDNPGFDPPSIARAAYQWYQEGEIVSGGSTITQQLVRQIVFDYEERTEQTLRRKLKEAALAWVMTQKYDKDEILELYLNEIYYGNLAYGIEEASNVYFDKHASELNIAEAAFLAGLPQSPSTYDPYTNFAAAKARQRQVLDLMVRNGFIGPAEADAAFNSPPLTVSDLASPQISLLAPHFTTEVRRQIGELPGIEPEMIARGGLVIITTVDMEMQRIAEDLLAQRIAEVRGEFNMNNAALVALNPTTGEVLAMVGSVDYNDESIDGAVNNILSQHQPGSAIKPLTYAAAFEQGWTPADILWDVPMMYDSGVGPYEPRNYDGRFHGPVRLRDALANSYNIPAVTLLREIGVPSLLEIAGRFGMESLGEDAAFYGLSLTLGGGEVTPMEMATSFSVFANGGHRVTPHVILRVTDNQGNVLYEAPAEKGEQVLDPRIAYQINSILSDNAARTPAMGAESPLLLEFPAAVKTGTTNDYRDNWTVGYTPHLTVAVWTGNTDNSPMAEGTSGLTGAAPIWNDYLAAVYALPRAASLLEAPGLPPLRSDFVRPDRLEERPVCVLSSLRDPAAAEEGCPRQRPEWFLVGGLDPSIPPTPIPTPTPVPTPIPTPDEEPPGPLPPVRAMLEPGLFQIGVLALDEERQATVVETLADAWRSLPASAPAPSPPLYCEMLQEEAALEGVSFQVFIAAPPDPIDAIRARNWAYANGVPIEPGVLCPPDLIEELVEEFELDPMIDPFTGSVYGIASPRIGEEVYGLLPVLGTATWTSEEVLFYKLEIGPGQIPDEYFTFGDIHAEQVEAGVLEYLHADALAPGPYVMRLVLVLQDGNTLPPYQIPITVVPAPEEVAGNPDGADVRLRMSTIKIRGVNHAMLTWSGAGGAADIYRDGSLLAANVDNNTYADNTNTRGPATFTYQVCEAGSTSACSNVVRVGF